MVPEIAERYQLHSLGSRILSEIESQTTSCIPPPRPGNKRKRMGNRTTAASASVPRQMEDAPSPNDSCTSKRVRLNQSSASREHVSTLMTHSRRDERNVDELPVSSSLRLGLKIMDRATQVPKIRLTGLYIKTTLMPELIVILDLFPSRMY
ncbi:hypothetical protein ASPZODRAFT_18692 [Penicilliopsis zonata CBS 506.65]|uniref:Uncharacterized protein n=1 Tax=Penicilliopsis zonata CBS 506.65 TaxID=1073090 RepID=A0A1L9SBE6_9EURO|nr:hypothetical protein ASPZODRAFT_18692 [Penicilliopsis zonata CBS 506.65]OJJ44503.1 hypothetical protein ASPZODRAFT_18692 [Penicilliopsis zonata CBS 506.65]